MKILITGGSGFLGVRLCQHLAGRHEVIAPTHTEMNITDAASTEQYICSQAPEAVIHCAAISSTAYAQQHPEESLAVNVEGTRNVAMACLKCGAKLLYMSSDQVYGGVTQQGLLSEDTPLAPTGIYGQHKLQAERIVSQLLPTAVGLRLTWMYDFPGSPQPINQNILSVMQNARLTNTPIRACTREYRGLTFVKEVVRMMEQASLLDLPGGVYNFGSENRLDSYKTYLRFAKQTGTPASLIIPDDSWQRNLSMSTKKIQPYGIIFSKTTE